MCLHKVNVYQTWVSIQEVPTFKNILFLTPPTQWTLLMENKIILLLLMISKDDSEF
jgi:hypothetical protein